MEDCRWAEDQLSHGKIVPPAETPAKVKRAGDNILLRGKVLKFLTRQAQRNHIGDTDVIKHFLASIASTNSATSSGIQPELNGPNGLGKTDGCSSVVHLIPAKWKLSASISAKSLYYYKDLPTGAIIFSDDVEWSPDPGEHGQISLLTSDQAREIVARSGQV